MHKQNNSLRRHRTSLVLISLFIISVVTAWADPPSSFRIAIFGDNRGDNKAWDTNTWDRYTDGGITKEPLIDIARALRAENVAFVLHVGDFVTKWTKQLKNITPDALFVQELKDWAEIWKTEAGNLPIFPVRGNQEVSASIKVWKDFIQSMPGIGTLTPNGPEGQELMTYAFKYRNCLFLGVDQYMPPSDNDSHYITPEAMEWIDQTLDPKNNKLTQSGHKFVWGHVPAFPIWDMKAKTNFTDIKDGLASPYAKFSFNYTNINWMEMREVFWEILGQRKARYICGHDHIFLRGVAPDRKGRLVEQITIGNGGAPPPVLPPKPVPAVYTAGPFVEAYTGILFPTVPSDVPYELISPRITTESFPLFDIPDSPPKVTGLPYGYGYLILEISGPNVTAIYKAEPAVGAGFQEVDRWVIASDKD